MRNSGERGRARLVLDPDSFARRERLVAYEIGNTLLMLNFELQQRFGLRAAQYQIFLLIVLSTVQRFARTHGPDEGWFDRTPLPPEASGSISRRRIAETLGIPQETVRRAVADLLARGMIVERRRGCLSTTGGTLARLSEDALPERMAHRFLSVSNNMIRLGAAEIAEPAMTPATKVRTAGPDDATAPARRPAR